MAQVCSGDCICMHPPAPLRAQPACTRLLAEARREALRVSRRLPALQPGRDYVLALPGDVLAGLAPALTSLRTAAGAGVDKL